MVAKMKISMKTIKKENKQDKEEKKFQTSWQKMSHCLGPPFWKQGGPVPCHKGTHVVDPCGQFLDKTLNTNTHLHTGNMKI